MAATRKNRFVPSLESLGERLAPATIGVEAAPGPGARDGYVLTGVSHAATLEGHTTTLEGHECLVFFLGGIPSRAESLTKAPGDSEAPDGRKFKPLFAPLIIDLDTSTQADPFTFTRDSKGTGL